MLLFYGKNMKAPGRMIGKDASIATFLLQAICNDMQLYKSGPKAMHLCYTSCDKNFKGAFYADI